MNIIDSRFVPPNEISPLRVEILECHGGGGHIASAKAVETALKNHFGEGNLVVSRPDMEGYIAPDLLGKVTRNRYTNIDFFNSCNRNGFNGTISTLTKIAGHVNKLCFPIHVRHFRNHYRELAPDLIISVIPMINAPLVEAVAVGDNVVPVMVVTTDSDSSLFSQNWKGDQNLGPHRYGIAYNSLEIAEKVHHAVDPENIRGMGYPVRPEFLKEYAEEEKVTLRSELGIESDKNVVGIMMGGLGGKKTKAYAKEILEANKQNKLQNPNSHFVVFCGKNKKMISQIQSMAEKTGLQKIESRENEVKFHDKETGMTLSILGFTKDVHKYMAISDVWITKTGSSSFNECLCMATPMLLDGTNGAFSWEQLNFELAETYGLGTKVQNFSHFIDDLNQMLKPTNNDKCKKALQDFRKERPQQFQFPENVVHLTDELLKEAEEKKVERANRKIEQEAKADAWKKLTPLEKTGKILSATFRKMVNVAKRIYDIALKILSFPFRWLAKKIVNYSFFSSFNTSRKVQKKRRQELIHNYNARPIEGSEKPLFSPVSNQLIDALHIPSQSENRTGNAIIYVLAKHYQNFHPQNFEHLLQDGADVVLFNPSENSAKAMSADLKEVIKELRRRNPEQKFTLHGYCIGAHVASAVAADIADGKVEGLNAESIPAIIDRGYGDGFEIAKKVTSVAKLSFPRKYIEKYYNSQVLSKIDKHEGSMLFLTPQLGKDQITHTKKKNFTLEIMEKHKKGTNQLLQLDNADHWTPWSIEVHNKVKKFLQKEGIISTTCTQVTFDHLGGEKKYKKKLTVPWARRNLVPLFV